MKKYKIKNKNQNLKKDKLKTLISFQNKKKYLKKIQPNPKKIYLFKKIYEKSYLGW